MVCILLLVLSMLSQATGGDISNSPFAVRTEPSTVGATCAANGSLHERRLAAVRNEILAKLRLTQEPSNPVKPVVVDRDMLSAYNLATQTASRRNVVPECSGERNSLFAKQLRLYFPTSYERVIPSAEIFEWGKSQSLHMDIMSLVIIKLCAN